MTKKTENGWLKKGYWGLVQGENFVGNFLLLAVRIYWGGLFVVTGFGKWMNIHGVADYFNSLHLPFSFAAASVVATIELLGGVSLFIGFCSRIFSLLLTIILATAYATAHKEALFHIFTNPSSFIMQEPFLFLYGSLVVLCFGPGLFSSDYWFERRTYGTPL